VANHSYFGVCRSSEQRIPLVGECFGECSDCGRTGRNEDGNGTAYVYHS
jgi:hypothetical protein